MAKHTGWSEDFILDELPLARAHAYQHAIMRQQGFKTRWVQRRGSSAARAAVADFWASKVDAPA